MRRPLLLAVGLVLAAAAPAHAQDPEPPPPEPPVIAEGVTIAGVAVGGLTQEQATAAVRAFFDRRLVYRLQRKTLSVAPATLRARARVGPAVRAALAAPAATALRLEVVVNKRGLVRWVRERARGFYRPARNSTLGLRGLRPWVTKAKPGRKLVTYAARRTLAQMLRRHERGPARLPVLALRPTLTRANFGPVVLIRRNSRRLYFYRGMTAGGMRLRRSFPIAVGQPSYPTPLGRFRIISMQRNPWWYPPSAGWASGASPIPPGPGNPLGTRWMGLSVGAVGIHGTYNPASIGGFASHGCIRMLISHSEWLFERVRIGTTVFIVGA